MINVSSPIEFYFSIRTSASCYVALNFYDDNNSKIKNVSSSVFSQSTRLNVKPPLEAESVKVYVGGIFAAQWNLPLKGEKSLEVKLNAKTYDYIIYVHKFSLATFRQEDIDASRG